MKHIWRILVLVLLCTVNGFAQMPAQTVPAFTFKKLNHATFSNKDLQHDKMLFFVFFDAGCDHCQRAIQYIGRRYEAFKRTAIYLISLDSVPEISRFMNKYGSGLKGKNNVMILQDAHDEFIRKFGPRKYPSLFLYSPKKELILYEDNEQNLTRIEQLVNSSGKMK